MILKETTNNVQQFGNITEESTFKMKPSKKAFMLLSGLYSDLPLAIVRELSTNCFDSHVAAGCPEKPFHIHLPNSLEPWMIIQDFGTGIQHKNIYDIYTTYFESTKTNTNDQVGCMGLGSKSFMAYADNASVTSITEGVKRIYNVFFNTNGIPSISLLSTQNTSEGNGLAVQIPIKEKDFTLFNGAIKKALRFFDIKPTISGGKIDWKEETPMFKGEDWMFFDSNQGWESFAIMGGVTYPIDHYKMDDKYNNILRKGVVLKFKMGELEFTPSRESLLYDDATIKALNDKLEKVLTEIKHKAKDQILAKDNLLEAIKAFHHFTERFSYYGSSNFEIKNLDYKGHDITEPFKFLKSLAPSVTHFYIRSYRKTISVGNNFTLDNNTDWYYEDGQVKNPIARVKMFVKDTQKSALFFKKDEVDDMVNAGIPASMFKSASTLPSPSAKRKVNAQGNLVVKAKEDITCYTLGATYNVSWDSKTITPADTDLPKFYIVKGKTWDLDTKLNGLIKINDKDRLIRYCKAFGIDPNKDVVMVTPKEVAKLEARGVDNFVDWFNEEHDLSWIDAQEVNLINSYSHRHKDAMNDSVFATLSDNNPIKQTIIKIAELREKYKNVWNIVACIDNLETLDTNKNPHKLDNEAQDFILGQILGAYGSNVTMYLKVAKEMEK